MKKEVGCELCGGAARVYCESDRASLCWGCDHKVHGANFLVGKHSRSLLCHRCQSPTPWTSSGSRIPPCMSLCLSCLSLAGTDRHLQSQPPQQPQLQGESSSPDEDVEQDEEVQEGYASYSDDDDDDDDEDDDDDDDDDENQVVPWTASSDKPADISVSSTSSEAEAEAEDEDDDDDDDGNAKTTLFSSSMLKRKRESAFLDSYHSRSTLPRL